MPVQRKRSISLLIGLCLLPLVSGAQTLRLTDGEAHFPDQFKELAIQVGHRYGFNDVKQNQLRLQLPELQDTVVLFIDASDTRLIKEGIAFNRSVEFDGDDQGFGLFYTRLQPWENWSTTVVLSHREQDSTVRETLAVASRQLTVERRIKSTSLGMMMSPQTPFLSNGANYAISFGATYNQFEQFASLDSQDYPVLSYKDEEINAYVELNAVYPVGRFRFFAALGVADSTSLSVGLRVPLSRTASR